MFHKEGAKIILITLILVVAVIFASDLITIQWLRIGLIVLALVFLVLILQFFRNPKREADNSDNHILAPVDGKVVVIEEVYEPEYFQDKRLMVSIFMSPINVHVTRYPVNGVVKYSKYHPGKYLVAWHPKASEENERTTVVINNRIYGEIMYRQIAGALARRIINYAKEGMRAVQGKDAGFIKFGSRVDIYLPLGTEVNVKLGEKAIGAKTVICKKINE
ncbi:phosphatidylserine decarboxylase family protein [Flavobacterium sp. TP390]|uniref:Phosphatidylserine decarboxylase proenzyme n=1 Tax=Flavobacterium profundi TaxID=1774945 RepID=A0A6I4IWV9_9FLAO|nr:phosphatidylserine decarboxylase family protein [Flavobacterium profundi]MVO10898.1 phosphatidylserine decarboxylase family protein [Flavobacterium profundi]